MTELIMADAERALARGQGAPIGRVGEPDDAAALVLYLVSDAATYLTGAGIVIDGGSSVVR